jgi:hypothetical protein
MGVWVFIVVEPHSSADPQGMHKKPAVLQFGGYYRLI